MYKCQKCGVQVGSKVPVMRKVEETRNKVYVDVYQDERGEVHERYIGEGVETVQELKLCHLCYGVEVPEEPKPERCTDDNPPPVGRYSVRLGNGQEIASDKPEDLYWFCQNKGTGMVRKKKNKKKI